MKNILTLLICFISIIAFGQETASPDKNILGGSFSFSADKNGSISGSARIVSSADESTSINFSFDPYYGRQISKSWLVGFDAGYGVFYSTRPSSSLPGVKFKTSIVEFNVGVFGRYSFFPNNKFTLFLQPEINYFRGEFKSFFDDIQASHRRDEGIEILMRPGASYQLGYNFQLVTRFGLIGASFGKENDIAGRNETVKVSSFLTRFSFSSFSFGAEMRF